MSTQQDELVVGMGEKTGKSTGQGWMDERTHNRNTKDNKNREMSSGYTGGRVGDMMGDVKEIEDGQDKARQQVFEEIARMGG